MSTQTTPTHDVSHDQKVTAAVAQLTALQDAKAQIEAQESALKATLRDLLPTPGAYRCGELMVSIQANRRFNVDAAAAMLTDTDLAACTVTILDARRVKERLTPLQVEDCMKDIGDHKVVIR